MSIRQLQLEAVLKVLEYEKTNIISHCYPFHAIKFWKKGDEQCIRSPQRYSGFTNDGKVGVL